MEENLKKEHVIIITQYTRHDHESIWEFPHLQGIKFSCMNTRSSYFESDARSLSSCCASYYLGVAQIDRLFWFKVAIGTQCMRTSTSQATRMSATRCRDVATTQHSSSLQYVPELTHGKQIGNRKQKYWKNKVHRVKQTIYFLSTPLFNFAMFQRIKWIFLNKWIRNTYQYRRLFIVFKYTKKKIFLYWNQRITAWLSTSFALKFIFLLLYLGYWFLSVLHSPIFKCFYSIAIGYRLIRLIICDYLLSTP